MNLASMVTGATLVLFAQEVLDIGPLLFSILGFGAAAGGIVGGTVAPWASKRYGSGTCLAVVLAGSAALSVVVGVLPFWPVVMVVFGVEVMLGTLWNVITVSLRQTIIPAQLLGRVNSVYRFFAWGMMPIGAALGGVTVVVVGAFVDRDWALRATWFVNGAIYLGLFVIGRAKLTTEKIEAARAAGTSTNPAAAS
jgi:MFS family permease